MKVVQIRKMNELLKGYRDDAEVKNFRIFVGGAVSFEIYNLSHFVTPSGGQMTFSLDGKLLDSECV